MPDRNKRKGNRRPNRTETPPAKKVSKRAMARLVAVGASCALSLILYRFLIETSIGFYVFVGYLLATAGLVFSYVIYNRGFSRNGVTREMLPDRMSEEEKDQFIQSGEERRKKSSWMMIPILACSLTLLWEAMELVVIPTFKELFL